MQDYGHNKWKVYKGSSVDKQRENSASLSNGSLSMAENYFKISKVQN